MKNPNLPSTVGVLGGGRMGAGIAHAFLIDGANVLVVERDEESAEAARERVEPRRQEHRTRHHRRKPGGVGPGWPSPSTTPTSGPPAVVEAVPEDWDLKVTALQAVGRDWPRTRGWPPTRRRCP